jgi:hypothetical protein
MAGPNMPISELSFGFTRAIWFRCLGPEKHRRRRSPRPWATGHLNCDGSGWSGRVQLRHTGRRTRRRTWLQIQVHEDGLDRRLLQDGGDDLRLTLRPHAGHKRRQLGAKVWIWPDAGSLPVAFMVTWPAASRCPHRLLWSRQIEKSNDSCQSEADQ